MAEDFGLEDQRRTEEAINFDGEMAHKLYNALRSRRMLMRSARAPSIKQWADQFRILRSFATEKEISNAMDWLINNLGGEYTPRVNSAKSFRLKFDQLCMGCESKLTITKLKPVEILPIVHRISERLQLSWPNDEKKDELQFLQHSYNNIYSLDRRFVKLLTKLRDEAQAKDWKKFKKKGMKSSKHWDSFRIAEKAHFAVAGPGELSKWWALEVNKTAWNWPPWDGNLLKWVLHDDNNRLNMLYSRAVAEFRGDGGEWQTIRKMLKEIKDGDGKS